MSLCLYWVNIATLRWGGEKNIYIKKNFIKKEKRNGRGRVQKGGAFGAGMALGMFLPQILGAASNILKINKYSE